MCSFMGFGVFLCNAVFDFQQWGDSFHSGWSWQKQGYLSESEHPYALALFCNLSGTGVNSSNNTALILIQGDLITKQLLLRTGDLAPGCGSAKLASISVVDCEWLSGSYVVLGTLSGAATTRNQALWMGNTVAGNDTTQRTLRHPELRLRKGDIYTSTSSPLPNPILSLTLKPAIDASGAGGRGLHQVVVYNGPASVFISTTANASELVLLR
jgi:hypothetical protein